ncbi:MAG: hypothetical protein GY833_21505 [Aestuariibacter sp.]|nr:hypothetical protein [Aestuariibacter sp.]
MNICLTKAINVITVPSVTRSADDRRVQVLTLGGRILQHKRTFTAGSRELNSLMGNVKAQLLNGTTETLDPSWWSDITDNETKRYRAINKI